MRDADCTVRLSQHDFQAIVQGRLDIKKAYFESRLQIHGDWKILARFRQIALRFVSAINDTSAEDAGLASVPGCWEMMMLALPRCMMVPSCPTELQIRTRARKLLERLGGRLALPSSGCLPSWPLGLEVLRRCDSSIYSSSCLSSLFIPSQSRATAPPRYKRIPNTIYHEDWHDGDP